LENQDRRRATVKAGLPSFAGGITFQAFHRLGKAVKKRIINTFNRVFNNWPPHNLFADANGTLSCRFLSETWPKSGYFC
jgi:hypothetical protein